MRKTSFWLGSKALYAKNQRMNERTNECGNKSMAGKSMTFDSYVEVECLRLDVMESSLFTLSQYV